MNIRRAVCVSEVRPGDWVCDGTTTVARIIRVNGDDIAAKLANDGPIVFWNKSLVNIAATTLPVRSFIRNRVLQDTGITLGGSLQLVRP
jgi:hypothetical protein